MSLFKEDNILSILILIYHMVLLAKKRNTLRKHAYSNILKILPPKK